MEKLPRNELLDKVEQAGEYYEEKYHGCSRCVLKAVQDHLGLGNDTCLRASTPLAGGVALHMKTCGALLGGLMALGIVASREDMADEKALFDSLALGFRLTNQVEKELGSTECAEIQKKRLGRSYNLADQVEAKEFLETGAYLECCGVVGKVARLTGAFILDYMKGKDEK